jgi:outer membrane protein TolC
MIRLKELLTQIAEKRMAEAMRRQAASPEMEKLAKTQGLELPGASVPADIGADKRSGMQDKPTDEPPSPQPKPAVSTNPDIVAAKERKAKRDAEIMAAAKAEFDDVMADKNDANVSPTTGKETGTALPQVDERKGGK